MDVKYGPSFSDLPFTVKSFSQRLPLLINIKTTKSCRAAFQNKLNAVTGRIDKARDMYLEDKLDEEDFKRIRTKYKAEIENLLFKLSSLNNSTQTNDVEKKRSQAFSTIVHPVLSTSNPVKFALSRIRRF